MNNINKINKLVLINILVVLMLFVFSNRSFSSVANKITIKQKDSTISVGSYLQLKATITPSNATNKKITWTSSNTKIATVDKNGKVKGLKVGKTTVIAKLSNGKKATSIVRVNIPVKSIKLSKTSVILEKGYSEKMLVTFNPTNASSKAISWSTSNPKIASVNKNGFVKGIANGRVTITATTNNGKKARCSVLVRDKVSTRLNGHNITLPGSDDRIYFLDVTDKDNGKWKASDAIIIVSNGKYALIDTGKQMYSNRIIKYLRDLRIKELEFILITHAHEDHIGGCSNIIDSGIKIKRLYIKSLNNGKSDAEHKSRVNKLINKAKNSKIPVCEVSKINALKTTLGDFTFKFFNTKNRIIKSSMSENVNSIVAVAIIHGKKIYLSGDITDDEENGIYAETEMAKIIGKIDFYKIAHHCYVWSSNRVALKYLNPSFAVSTNYITCENTNATRERIFECTAVTSERMWYTATGTVILTIKPNGVFDIKKLAEDR